MGKGEAASVWIVYMLRCRDDSLYTGITNNLPQRLLRHTGGTASAYTRSRRPVRLVYHERQPTRSAALRREAALRRVSPAAKPPVLLSRPVNLAPPDPARRPAAAPAHL